MTWNYRIIRKCGLRDSDGKRIDEDDDLRNVWYAIHEVYYDENDKPFMCSMEPEYPCGETVDELIWSFSHFIEAFNKPILDYDEIPEEGAHDEIAETMKELQDENGEMRPIEELKSEGKLKSMDDIIDELGLSDFDMKEYQNEQAVERQKCEKSFGEQFVGLKFPDLINKIFEKGFEDEDMCD